MQKVLITSHSFGSMSRKPFEILERAGVDWTVIDPVKDPTLFSKIVADYDAVIVGINRFDAADMERCKKLKIISKNGVGLDNLDLAKAKELGITVTYVPAVNSDAVADLAFAHLLNLSRGITMANRWVRDGQWRKYIGHDVYRKTLGLVGFGAIAKRVARRACGFSMKVLAYDPYLSQLPEEFEGFVQLCDLDTVLQGSDLISIHVPLTAETRNLFNRKNLLRMRPGALLVNTSRGGIVNEDDLLECLQSGHLGGAALDVLQTEPIKPNHPLARLDNVVITPHLGASTAETIDQVGVICATCVADKLSGRTPEHVVV